MTTEAGPTRRALWARIVAAVVARRVLGGPFRGMRYRADSAGSTLMPKVLGTYEREIWRSLASLLEAAPPGVVIDVGAGEGYYVTGLLCSNRATRVVAFEADAAARDLLAALARANGVADRVDLRGYCDAEALAQDLEGRPPVLAIVDVEGGEVALLAAEVVRRIATTHLVVELHPWVEPRAGEILTRRLSASHDVTIVAAREPRPEDIEFGPFRWLAKLHRRLAKRLLQERPEGMSWLVARARGKGVDASRGAAREGAQ